MRKFVLLLVMCCINFSTAANNNNTEEPTHNSVYPPAPPEFGTYFGKYVKVNGLVDLLGTYTTSDAKFTLVKNQVELMINSLKNESDKQKLNGHKVILISPFDNITNVPYVGNDPTARAYRGGGGSEWSLVDENLTDNIGHNISPLDNSYRCLDHVTHEFGHSIEFRLGLVSKFNEFIQKTGLNNPTYFPNEEYWAYGVQDWFSQEYTAFSAAAKKTKTRDDMVMQNPLLFRFMKDIFDEKAIPIKCN